MDSIFFLCDLEMPTNFMQHPYNWEAFLREFSRFTATPNSPDYNIVNDNDSDSDMSESDNGNDTEQVDELIDPLIDGMINLNIYDGNYAAPINLIDDDNRNEDYNANLDCNQYEFDESEVYRTFQNFLSYIATLVDDQYNFGNMSEEQFDKFEEKMLSFSRELKLLKRERGSTSSDKKFKSLKDRWFRRIEFPLQLPHFYMKRNSIIAYTLGKGDNRKHVLYKVLSIYAKYYNKWFMFDPEHDRNPKDKKGREIKDPKCKVHMIMIEKAGNKFQVVDYDSLNSDLLRNNWKKVVWLTEKLKNA
eukprot:Pgem_evm1s18092